MDENLPESMFAAVTVTASLDHRAGKSTEPVVSNTPMELNKKLNRKRHESTMSVSNRLRKVPSVFTKPDKSVQFAQENTILVIDDDN